MRISLIGMAGSGKSYWSKRIAEHGFTRFCCDELIAEKLASELAGSGGPLVDMGKWMGFPYQAGYEDREARYLALERETMAEVIAYLEADRENPQHNIVVDTTGSVIYTGKENLEKLRLYTTVVYLAITSEVREQLLRAYISDPHPMLWKGVFHREPQETNREALARCYPMLVNEREREYEQLAEVTIPYHKRRAEGFGIHDFLHAVRLPKNRIRFPTLTMGTP
jgi:shikimate kinase